MYIFGVDLSLSNSGVCIFDYGGNPVEILSIPTDPKLNRKDRLKIIGDAFLKLREKYETNLIIFEAGFSRHIKSTQALYAVKGLVMYLFADCEQEEYAPLTVKKVLTGTGKADKDAVQKYVLERFPDIEFKNKDESDAVATILTYFIKNDMIKS